MNINLSIVKLTSKDIDFVKDLEQKNNLSIWSNNDYADEVKRKDSTSLIIKNEVESLGFIIARLIKNTVYSEAEIYNIAVKSAYRSLGFGKLLLDELIARNSKHKLTKIWLEVRTSNMLAIKFYKKNDFNPVGERKNFYSHPTEDAILMCRDICI